MQPIQTKYNGCLFRSKLEAQWAVFFDACHADWEYEPEGYKLSNGQWYLPDFLLHDVYLCHGGDKPSPPIDLYVEVKGKMQDEDAKKIKRFVSDGFISFTSWPYCTETPTLVVGRLPVGETIDEMDQDIITRAYRNMSTGKECIHEFNFDTVDFDNYEALPGIGKFGGFMLFGSNYIGYRNHKKTKEAFLCAKMKRFDHGGK